MNGQVEEELAKQITKEANPQIEQEIAQKHQKTGNEQFYEIPDQE